MGPARAGPSPARARPRPGPGPVQTQAGPWPNTLWGKIWALAPAWAWPPSPGAPRARSISEEKTEAMASFALCFAAAATAPRIARAACHVASP